MLTIKSSSEIINELLSDKQAIRNFPKSLTFPFNKLYIDLTTQISTTEISSECILFDSVAAVNETKEFVDPDYWIENYPKADIDKFWVFAQNGQGDLWLFDREDNIYFYDHNQAQMADENFLNLDLNFEKWLRFADLNRQLDQIYDIENEIDEELKVEYKTKLNELSKALLAKYPFDI
ncbi:hypothetical protein EZ449_03600 [Pedobacter frigidisoli]|uniref:SMI1 / KNR4 family (SUKH-1) n=1 Tax=Pedobacter frigidisoli TaxID=2530455 RepID=A0A4R0P872_9SPHI|nr:SMI1/KNR4 family protein [Pedobacter frigidisoli]TCD12114.1 hypothetical protein EZ449_03600 [Pedobacter frigidisoli]